MKVSEINYIFLALCFLPKSLLVKSFQFFAPQTVYYDRFHGASHVTFVRNGNLMSRELSSSRRSRIKMNSIADASETRKISRLEKEFVQMVSEFREFTDKDISGVDNYRYRAMYRGVNASRDVPEVERAFVILYEEIIPLRLAGRMIHKHLKSVMKTSKEKQKLVEANILKSTKLSPEEIYEGRIAFLELNANADGELTIDELVETGIIDTIVELLGFESFDSLLEKLDEDEVGKLDFERFMIGLQKCMDNSDAPGCNISTVLDEIVDKMEAFSSEDSTADMRKMKYSKRYDEMVNAFSEWEDLVPSGDGRMIEVLTGCFYGAKNEEIVNALKIVYVDYAALRTAGDLIFKLMSALVGRKSK